jgi:NAD(P)-dependent dehydrogenase (short-subunit alcohol dehydrogenase family)
MGLGFETARQLRALGHTVIIAARDLSAVQPLAAQIGATPLGLDVTSDASVAAAAQFVRDTFGRLDVLVNNAGAYFDQGGEPLQADIQFVKDALDTNLLGAWRMAKAFVPLLGNSAQGRIVNVSSGAGSFADPVFGLPVHPQNVPVYGISKLALNGLTVKLARQLKGTNIKVNSVCPGFVATYPGTEAWGARPVAEGAKGIVWAATLPASGPTGGFFRDGQPLGW